MKKRVQKSRDGYVGKPILVINEYYTGTRTLKEKLLSLMIRKTDQEKNI